MLVFQNNEMADMLVYQTNYVGDQLSSYANMFFRSNKFACMGAGLVSASVHSTSFPSKPFFARQMSETVAFKPWNLTEGRP